MFRARATRRCSTAPAEALHTAAVTSAAEIERRCGSPAHQGVCADAGAYPYAGAGELLATPNPLLVALDQLQDPQNVGSICRTAECVGAAGVVIAELSQRDQKTVLDLRVRLRVMGDSSHERNLSGAGLLSAASSKSAQWRTPPPAPKLCVS